MSTIHVTTGVGRGPTETAAYDAALAAANLHDYNLVTVSSVVPPTATVERIDAAPNLGPTGGKLFCVQGRAETAGPGTVAAGLGWATGPGPGLFYEADGQSAEAVRERVARGLDAGLDLREWTVDDREVVVVDAEAAPGEHVCVVAVAAYGEAEPIC
ncbi:MAG: pyruvoyl-dependent arginine decarboxylase [Halolamina sp.]